MDDAQDIPLWGFRFPQSPIAGNVILFLEEFLSMALTGREFLQDLDFFHRFDHDPVIYLGDQETRSIQTTIDALMSEYRQQQFGRAATIESLLRILLIQLQRHYQDAHKTAALSTDAMWIDQFQKLVDQHHMTKRSVQKYADLLGITAGHLTMMSKQVTGLPAGVLIRNQVVLETKRLLAHTDRTATQICYNLNYGDPSYIGRLFKRETGQRPLSFHRDFKTKYQNL